MRYATAAAFRQALDDRLKAEAARTGLGLARLRKRVAFEFFLRRLVAVAPDRWVLKGALALDFRFDSTVRRRRRVHRFDLVDSGRDRDLRPSLVRRHRTRSYSSPALPQHVAEKVHAYTRKYGATERESTRPKDLVDILLIAASEPLDAASLRKTLVVTFEERQQQPLPSSLPPPPQGGP
jgi:hypothetical protein